jgi:Reverse transcriptase (RNA-dependent DNA polymerase)
MPLPSEIFLRMQGKKVFSKIDTSSAYHQIRVAEGYEKYTAFATPFDNFEYRVMPFGLALAPAIFQRAITYTLFKFIGDKVAVYLDDIIIATDTLKENKQLLTEIIRKLVSNDFYGNSKKCQL